MPEIANTNDTTIAEDRAHHLATQTAWISGIFVVVVAALLLVDFGRRQAKDPSEVQNYKDLKTRLAQNPLDENLKKQIRQTDLGLRQSFFHQKRFTAIGAWLLLAGTAVFLVAAKTAVTVKRRLPMPQPQSKPQEDDIHTAASARWSVAGLGLILVVSTIALSMTYRADLRAAASAAPSGQGGTLVAAPAPSNQSPYPSDEEIKKYWPGFRGPGGSGVSAYTNVPAEWDGPTGKGILWKAAVGLPGNSSPIVWADRVFLTGADEQKREVFCFDANTGKLLWEKPVPGTAASTAKPPEVMEDTGFAAPTPVTDGRRVYAIFANGDLGAFDFTGNPAWSRSLGVPENIYGHASSLAMYRDRLIVQFDQGEPDDKLSKLMALDAATGTTVWATPREMANSWTSPIVINHQGREMVITAADPWVIAYNAADGKEVWRCNCLRQDVGPSPVCAGGVVYVVNQAPQLSAIRADGQGDVTKTKILWIGEDNLPDTASPLATEKHVFTIDGVYLTCYQAASGEKLWEYEPEGAPGFSASPSLVGNRVYLVDLDGKTRIVEVSDQEAKLVGECELGEGCVASPAFQDGRIYLRGKENLFCIGQE